MLYVMFDIMGQSFTTKLLEKKEYKRDSLSQITNISSTT